MKATQCTVDGCDRGGKIVRGMCNLHYLRWKKHGTTEIVRLPAETHCGVDGCDRTGKVRRGMCNMHHKRLNANGTTDPRYLPSPAERLAAGLVRMPSGCLEWTPPIGDGCRRGDGYGRIYVDDKKVLTHRLAWELVNGPIPEGLCVLHRCDNPPCCETEPTDGYPDGHLFLGTRVDNNEDMAAKGRAFNGNAGKTHCPQGHEYAGPNLYTAPDGRRTCRTCTNVFKKAARLRLAQSA